MFNLGTGELLIIFLVILLLFGAKRLPELARGLGKGINEFKDAVETGKKEILDAEKGTENKTHAHRMRNVFATFGCIESEGFPRLCKN